MEKYPKLDCSDFADFKNKEFDNGVLTLNLTTWDEFPKVAQKLKNYTDYIWRGQRCYCDGWKLKSSFDRKFEIYENSKRNEELKRILNKFKQKLADLSDTNNIDFAEDEIWAIGQHYGLPTPLLDWTESPYIAAYFAFFKGSTKCQTEYRVVYALNRALKLYILKAKNAVTKEVMSKNRIVEFDLGRNNLDKIHNQRLKNQKGTFIQALEGDDIKTTVENFWEKTKGKYQNKILLAEILIPDKARDECMSYLRSQKITHGTLFPDYAGAVEICKIELLID